MPAATRLNDNLVEHTREIVAEEFNNAFNEIMPNVTADIINQVRDLFDERIAALQAGGLPNQPTRDSAYYFEKFTKCHPPQWNGDMDPVAAKHWLADIESALMTIGCPDQFRVIVAMSQLRKDANAWWSNVTTLVTPEGVRNMTWPQFVERFEAQYVPKVEQQRMMQELLAYEQKTETVTAMNTKFLQMVSFCPSIAGNEEWLVGRYAAALRTEIREFVSMQDFTTLSTIMDAARRREIELQTQQLKRKAESTSSRVTGDSGKKQKEGWNKRYEYRPPTGQGAKGPPVCFNCKRTGHHWKECSAPPMNQPPKPVQPAKPVQTTFAPVPVCFQCGKAGHKRPDCPDLKNGGVKSGGGSRVTHPSSSAQGHSMVTRGRVHQLTEEEPVTTATVKGNLFFHDSLFLYC